MIMFSFTSRRSPPQRYLSYPSRVLFYDYGRIFMVNLRSEDMLALNNKSVFAKLKKKSGFKFIPCLS